MSTRCELKNPPHSSNNQHLNKKAVDFH